ncbi:SSU ribosomal protein S8p (S15Ae) [Labilithrix luteola]|uniref:Small ribosomal subunit protein uS8 n=1 Tax=Labilithrix luteola TaxID=1391654 RepID=A0A0K1PJ40_9BACT|nr:30S ribosomal protein S8 [Labilithrix luteola]AKU93537.1 SSU ribosomal protein S8p (S15Ae) [Labilithrix luteola]
MMTDPISDMLARIRNAALARHDRAEMPHSHVKQHIAAVLKAEGFLDDVRVSEGEGRKTLTLVMRYGRDRASAIDGVRRISAPGRRVYVRFDRIPRVRSGMGISILSTSRGVMTDRQAREQRVGGELLCEVW